MDFCSWVRVFSVSHCIGPMPSSSEEEGEIVENRVTDYRFVDSKGQPISFSTLSLWGNDKVDDKEEKTGHLFLVGKVGGGLQKTFKKAIAWRIELYPFLPEIHVLLDSGQGWFELQTPHESYEAIARTVSAAVKCLHFMKRNSDGSEEVIREHIRKTLSALEAPPENRLADHLPWITEAALRDKDIEKAKSLSIFLSEMSGKRKASCNELNCTWKKLRSMNDENDSSGVNDDNDGSSDTLLDRVCALCDDGGNILCCEGNCMRSFHPTIESGAGSLCESLGYTNDQVEAIPTFMCPNCQYQLHQCFICGKLGSSDKSLGAEVFACVSATCGRFYHPKCVSEMIFTDDEYKAQKLRKLIEDGDSFTCPAHKCFVCKKVENGSPDVRFAICRRCPKVYHRKCLPRDISFKRNDVMGIPQRAWDDLLPKRTLIYCMDHKINSKLLTPKRNHLLFPYVSENELQQVVLERRSKTYGTLTGLEVEAKHLRKDIIRSDNIISGSEKTLKGKVSKTNSRPSIPQNATISEREQLKETFAIGKIKLIRKSDWLTSMQVTKKIPAKSMAQNVLAGGSGTLRDTEMEKRIHRLIKSTTDSMNMKEFLKERSSKCTLAYPTNSKLDKSITMGKVECMVKAIRAALKKLENGGTIDDAKSVCEPDVLTQLIKWKKRLKVYLGPFIHGTRYTSFGRHFTKVDKLKEIVDFSCGSNDFSCLLKEELDRMGRKCFFKNYDKIQSKNDFGFEKRDWMSVCLEELPEGSNLIMGLNPPFGAQAFHANQFIDKALTFHPKLLILIVPKETESLDRKKSPYDLIWVDDQVLSGKSFYLPGSINVHDQQMDQWNLDPPPLYLWSRPDWTAKHKAVANQHGHICSGQGKRYSGGISTVGEDVVSNYLMEENQDCYCDFSYMANGYADINSILEDLPEASDGI
ncbi:protein ENHANCED DOWNY MILDEW 2-like isoform X2 [Henckelia pumila]|uniref:protein ENHANCED DOWNY MILDEW 2-like isoform X2 n=1 Tax=Henckelia pumila TaxID=405737 RepID=UPI003C6DB987